ATEANARANQEPVSRKRVALIEYMDTRNTEITREGLMAALEHAGLMAGKDFDLQRNSAQGDIATLNSIVDNAITQRSDLLITASTPALQAVWQKSRGPPFIFAMVSNPFIVGAGTDDTHHLPFLTGAYLNQPANEMLAALKSCVPHLRRIGTLYTPGEINSV